MPPCVYCVGESRVCRNALTKNVKCLYIDRKQHLCIGYRLNRRSEL